MDKKDLKSELIDKRQMYLDSVQVDKKMDSTPIDVKSDFGKGIYYKTCDGKDVQTMEEVMKYNQTYYERMKIQSERKTGMHR